MRATTMARTRYTSMQVGATLFGRPQCTMHLPSHNAVYRSASDSPHTFDYIVCAHKAINPSAIPEMFSSVTTPSTTFVIMQNGVGNEDPFRQKYPQNTIISGVIWIGATQTSPGIIKHMQAENTEIGLFPRADSSSVDEEKAKLERFAVIMRQGGTNISVEENIQVKRWEKVVWNAAWNSIGESRPCLSPFVHALIMIQYVFFPRLCYSALDPHFLSWLESQDR